MARERDRYTEYEKQKKRTERLKRLHLDVNSEDNFGLIQHSSAYHAYFEGYAEVKCPLEKGGHKIKRVYAAPYYASGLSGKQMAMRRIIYALSYAVSVASLIFAASRDSGANRTWYQAAATLAALLMEVRLGAALYNFLIVPQKMRVGQYRASHEATVKYSFIAAAALMAVLLCTGVYMLISGDTDLNTVSVILVLLPAAAVLGIVGLTESRTVYSRIANDTVLESGVVMIE